MPRILVIEAFKFAVDGNHVIEVAPGEQDVSERCAEVAVDHLKVASRLKGPAPVVAAVAPVVTPTPPVAPPAPAKPAAKPKAATRAKPAAKAPVKAGGAA